MTKSHREQTQFSPGKKTLKQRVYYFYEKRSSRSICNTTWQYLRDSDHNDDNYINYKIYFHRKKPWLESKTTFKGAHNVSCKI